MLSPIADEMSRTLDLSAFFAVSSAQSRAAETMARGLDFSPSRSAQRRRRVRKGNRMRLGWLLGVIGVSSMLLGAETALAAAAGECEVPKKYATLQSAINDPKCLVVHAAQGDYTEQLTITRSLTLAGSGERHTTLYAPATMADPKAIIRVVGRKVKVKIKHFTIQGPGTGSSLVGVRLEKDTTGTLTNVIINDIRQQPLGSGADFIGIHAGVPGGPQITKLNVDNSTINDSQGAAILLEGQGSLGNITYSVISGTGDRPASTPAPVGIIIRDGAQATVTRTDVNDNRAPAGGGEIRKEVGPDYDTPLLATQQQKPDLATCDLRPFFISEESRYLKKINYPRYVSPHDVHGYSDCH
jgi:hypothetical protein